MLRTRFITAGIVIAFLIPLLVWGRDIGVTGLVAIFSTTAAWELIRCLPALNRITTKAITLLFGILCVAAFYILPFPFISSILVFIPLAAILIHLFLYNFVENTLDSAGQMILAPFYAVVPLCHAIPMIRLDDGVAWVFYVLVVNSLGDAGAYFAGKYSGRLHFSKRVSPAKTVEGLLGGVVGNFLGMLIIKFIVWKIASWEFLITLTIVTAIIGPLGDLCASAIKRRLQIKDYGSILPGHGGVMDRADSLIFVFPTVFYFLVISGAAFPR